MSVFEKSSPLNSSGSPETAASAYEKQSPKFRFASWRPRPKRRHAVAPDFHLFACDGHDVDAGLVEEEVELAAAGRAEPGLDDDGGFKSSGRGHQADRVFVYRDLDLVRLGLVEQQGENGGGCR